VGFDDVVLGAVGVGEFGFVFLVGFVCVLPGCALAGLGPDFCLVD